MQLSINIEKRYVYLILATVVFLAGAIVAVAYNPTDTPPAVPSTMGHTVNEIENFEQKVTAIIQSVVFGGTVTCGSAVFDSPVANPKNAQGNNKYDRKINLANVGPGCLTNTGCIIKQEIYYNSSKVIMLKLARQYNYNQNPVSNLWWSSYQISGEKRNGDTAYDWIIPEYGSLYLNDDQDNLNGLSSDDETSSTEWAALDRSNSYGMKIYICSEEPIIDI